ncbi:MAG: gliding motility-associated C-terminal domain-containing protein [Elusimicrobia bacterium]|nr:gliding motility-associated C-terminal domain-containing protein [Elusimicrobiota bacterium]
MKPKATVLTGVSNRILTPNGDGFNDKIFFTVENGSGAEVSGKILDLKGAQVAAMTPDANPVVLGLFWDGRSGGQVVPSGVYVYVIEAEGKVFSGTVVVVK